jgi:7-carboxy-7-deazaguanine synthase
MSRPLKVSRIIAPTIQGEGPFTGIRTALVRLAGCNLHCAACDEPETRKPEVVEHDLLLPDQILEIIRERGKPHRINHVMITGGEPLIHQRAGLRELVEQILMGYRSVHIETNGTISPDQWLQQLIGQTITDRLSIVVSPKLSGPLATDPRTMRIKLSAISMFAARGAKFKFVCAQESDVAEVAKLVDQVAIKRRNVWIMGEGTTIDQSNASLAKIATLAVDSGFNLSGRLHLAAWQGGE